MRVRIKGIRERYDVDDVEAEEFEERYEAAKKRGDKNLPNPPKRQRKLIAEMGSPYDVDLGYATRSVFEVYLVIGQDLPGDSQIGDEFEIIFQSIPTKAEYIQGPDFKHMYPSDWRKGK